MADIYLLSFLEHVRRRPGMYVGGTDALGLRHLALWLLRDAFSREVDSPATRVELGIAGPTATITDDRRPARLDLDSFTNMAEQMGIGSRTSLTGLREVAVTNALSRRFVLEVWRDGEGLRSEYAGGQRRAGPDPFTATSDHGVRVQFDPDPSILSATTWDVEWLRSRCRELAAMSAGVRVGVEPLGGVRREFCYPDGPASWVDDEVAAGLPRPALRATGTRGELRCDVGWTFVTGDAPVVRCFSNTAPNRDGGNHRDGFLDAVGSLGRTRGLVPLAFLSVELSHPRYESPTKSFLSNPELRPLVRELCREALDRALADETLRAALVGE